MGKHRRPMPRYLREATELARRADPARPWRYSSAIAIDESQSVQADPEKQHYTVNFESVYYSMKLRCEKCGEEFWFSANEQRVWYEEWRFWIDSVPRHCPGCRKLLRKANGRD